MQIVAVAVLSLAFLQTQTEARAAGADRPASPTAQVDKVFERFDTTRSPGCALAVIQGGRVVYKRGYGMANLDHDVIITPSTVFHVASVSKQFTAFAILLLAEQRKLSLDDEVRKYIPELPDFGKPITIRHLIHHTSGLRDQWVLLGLAGWRYSLDLITDDDVLELVSRQKELNFQPGDRHLYCNTGYTLLGQIVKRVSGQSLREFTAARIFEPLGMKNTHFRDDHAEIVKNQAYGYAPAKDGSFALSVTNFDTVGATSLLTTVEDLGLWDRNFYEGTVGGRALVERMLQPGRLNDGERLKYAFGLLVDTYKGLPVVDHAGGDAGYRADLLRFPEQHFTVACLCNLSTSSPSQLARQVADVYLAQDLKQPETAAKPEQAPEVKLTEEQLRRWAGTYWNRDGDVVWKYEVKEDRPWAVYPDGRSELRPLGESRFTPRVARPVEFQFDDAGPGRRLTLFRQDAPGKPDVFEAANPFTPSPQQLAEYAGVYAGDEIDALYRIVVDKEQLVLKRLKSKPVAMQPMIQDVFLARPLTVRFFRDGAGRVSGALVSSGSIRNLRLQKR
jgi:CubicO group peptidase (beta-lactamase class C family)